MMFRIYHVRFGSVFRPFVAKCHRRRRPLIKVTIKEFDMTVMLTFVLSLLLGAPQTTPQAAGPRFDLIVRTDFFAGFAGDQARMARGMEACERVLADNPNHAEALVWHGSGLAFNAGQAFQKGDMKTGGELWQRGMGEMDKAVALEPDNVGVRIPRGALLLQATRNMPPEMARALLEKGVTDYEHVLALQSAYFATLGDHPKGELLFGLAEGHSRLGNADKARAYFERLIVDAPASGQAPKASAWLSTGAIPKSEGLGCVGCHK
jgi:tetratricopeptide (TPR) repeat protein